MVDLEERRELAVELEEEMVEGELEEMRAGGEEGRVRRNKKHFIVNHSFNLSFDLL